MSSNQFVAPTGYVDINNDCQYSIDTKTTRSREEVNPKEDLAFYFNTYIVPKYGLNNINVSNVASFMKDLEMNWTKLDQKMKGQVMDIMVDGILSKDGSFKTDLLTKLNIPLPTAAPPSTAQVSTPTTGAATISSFGEKDSKSKFGNNLFSQNNIMTIAILFIILGLSFVIMNNANFFKK